MTYGRTKARVHSTIGLKEAVAVVIHRSESFERGKAAKTETIARSLALFGDGARKGGARADNI